MSDSSQVENRVLYFITHYLPWIGIIMLLALISICYYHYYHKTCIWAEKEKKDNNDPFSYEALYKYMV
jgi:hypothetical protein